MDYNLSIEENLEDLIKIAESNVENAQINSQEQKIAVENLAVLMKLKLEAEKAEIERIRSAERLEIEEEKAEHEAKIREETLTLEKEKAEKEAAARNDEIVGNAITNVITVMATIAIGVGGLMLTNKYTKQGMDADQKRFEQVLEFEKTGSFTSVLKSNVLKETNPNKFTGFMKK